MHEPFCICLFPKFRFGIHVTERGGCMQDLFEKIFIEKGQASRDRSHCAYVKIPEFFFSILLKVGEIKDV